MRPAFNTRTILAAIAVLVVIAGAFGYFRWKKSPQYSLNQVKHAIETHDLMMFEKYVDTETLVGRFVDQTLAKSMEEQQVNDEASELGVQLGQGILQLMKPQLVSTVEQQIKTFVEQGAEATSEQGENDTAANFADVDFEVEGVKKDGKIATVTLMVHGPEEDKSLEIKMRQMQGYWQVIELSNALELVEQIDPTAELQKAREKQKASEEIPEPNKEEDDHS